MRGIRDTKTPLPGEAGEFDTDEDFPAKSVLPTGCRSDVYYSEMGAEDVSGSEFGSAWLVSLFSDVILGH